MVSFMGFQSYKVPNLNLSLIFGNNFSLSSFICSGQTLVVRNFGSWFRMVTCSSSARRILVIPGESFGRNH